jgi:hypothetical protein
MMKKELLLFIFLALAVGCGRPERNSTTNHQPPLPAKEATVEKASSYVPSGDATWDRANAIVKGFN